MGTWHLMPQTWGSGCKIGFPHIPHPIAILASFFVLNDYFYDTRERVLNDILKCSTKLCICITVSIDKQLYIPAFICSTNKGKQRVSVFVFSAVLDHDSWEEFCKEVARTGFLLQACNMGISSKLVYLPCFPLCVLLADFAGLVNPSLFHILPVHCCQMTENSSKKSSSKLFSKLLKQ